MFPKISRSFIAIMFFWVGSLFFSNQMVYGNLRLTDPGPEAFGDSVYHVSKRGGIRTVLHISVDRESIEGEDIYRMQIAEETGLITEIRLVRGSLRPLLAHQVHRKDLVYTVNYGLDQAEVMVAENQAMKTREVIPKIFLRFLGLFTEAEAYPDLTAIDEQPFPIPNQMLLKSIKNYVQEKELLPSEEGNTLRTVLLPKDVYAVQSLPFVLSGFPFETQNDISIHVSYMPYLMVVWNMRAKNLGEEVIAVPAGTIRCYKIQLETNEPFSRFAFGDKTYFWMQASPPHQLVKSRFPAAGETSILVDYRRK